MSDMKCPFCGEKIEHIEDGWCNCKNRCIGSGSISLWQELIRTRKTLEQSEICCTEWEKQALDYKAENINLSDKIGKLETELERTRKALDVALDWLGQVATFAKCDDDLCREFTERKLAEIKAILEQKED